MSTLTLEAIPRSVKERPILFSGAMVRAILDGLKTQTRRVIKPQPVDDTAGSGHWYWTNTSWDAHSWPQDFEKFCPHGQPGDRLWVRETFKLWDYSFNQVCCEYKAGGEDRIAVLEPDEKPSNLHSRKVDGSRFWRPSIFMPRWASRIMLEIDSVRVERLREISQVDAMREGTQGKHSFAVLWDSINGKGSWELNPWVWVIEFKKL